MAKQSVYCQESGSGFWYNTDKILKIRKGSMLKTIGSKLTNMVQRKPNLELYFQENDGSLTKNLAVFNPNSTSSSKPSEYINVNLILTNTAKKPAEFVKIEIDFQRKAHNELEGWPMRLFPVYQYLNFWCPNTETPVRLQALFHGGRDFVLHGNDEESIGRVVIPCTFNTENSETIVIPCRLRTLGMTRKDGQLTLRISPKIDRNFLGEMVDAYADALLESVVITKE